MEIRMRMQVAKTLLFACLLPLLIAINFGCASKNLPEDDKLSVSAQIDCRPQKDIANAVGIVNDYFDAWNEANATKMNEVSFTYVQPSPPQQITDLIAGTEKVEVHSVCYEKEEDKPRISEIKLEDSNVSFDVKDQIIIVVDFTVYAEDGMSVEGFTHNLRYENVKCLLVRMEPNASWKIFDFDIP